MIINLRNFPEVTAKMHLEEFNFIWYFLKIENTLQVRDLVGELGKF